MQDVAAEQERVMKGNADQEMLVVRDFVKVYPAKGRKTKPLAAVRGVSVGIKPQECFGLLVCPRVGQRSMLFNAAQHAFCGLKMG
jgi:ATP-binding cassette subfamily A (ABC1) protein 2